MYLKETVFIGICQVIILGVFFYLIGFAMDNWIRQDCYRWQKYEKQYSSFELNEKDIATCKNFNIIIK